MRLVALTGASNVTGYLPPIRQAARIAHSYGAEVFVDCAQLVAHRPLCIHSDSSDEDLDYAGVFRPQDVCPARRGRGCRSKENLRSAAARSSGWRYG